MQCADRAKQPARHFAVEPEASSAPAEPAAAPWGWDALQLLSVVNDLYPLIELGLEGVSLFARWEAIPPVAARTERDR